jgi:hypothetical protein
MGKIKWFLGEFFVVVAGVLVAFLLNGWWMNMREAQKERNYLVKIHDDLEATIENVTEAEEQQRKTVYAASTLLKAAYSTESVSDSLLNMDALRSMSFAPASQVSATLTTLVTTGDLDLISNDSLRMTLGELVSSLESYTSSVDHMAFDWLIPAYERFADVVNVADLRYDLFNDEYLTILSADTLSGFAQPTLLKRPPRKKWNELLETTEFRKELTKLHIAQTNLWRLHESFLKDLNKNKRMLEAEIERMRIKKFDQ